MLLSLCLSLCFFVFVFIIEHHDAATFFLYRSPFLPSVGSHSVRAPLFTKKAKTRMKATHKYSHKYVTASLFTNKDIARRTFRPLTLFHHLSYVVTRNAYIDGVLCTLFFGCRSCRVFGEVEVGLASTCIRTIVE